MKHNFKLHTSVKKIVSILLFVLVIIPAIPNITFADTYQKQYCTATLDDDFVDNEIIIVVMPFANYYEYNVASFSSINCIGLKELSVEVEYDTLCRIIKLTIADKSKQAVLDAIALLEERNDIYSAEPNYIAYIESTSYPEYEEDQWNLTKISLHQASTINSAYPTTTVRVGIIDSGIQSDHEDLDGLVNESLSKSFLPFAASALEDRLGHGTGVAGIIAANGIGIEGIAPNVELVSLRLTHSSYSFDLSYLVEAIEYASNSSRGIQILNFSAGVLYDQISSQSITYLNVAINGYSGLFVCSAGNSRRNIDIYHHYPSDFNALSNVISVGATRINDQMYENSNYGKTKVDLFAPGADVISTISTNVDPVGYHYFFGASIATAHVTGVAAYMLSVNPLLSSEDLKNILIRNVDEKTNLEDLCVSGGRLNAYKSVLAASKLAEGVEIEYETYSATAHTVYYNDCGDCYECENRSRYDDSYCDSCGYDCWISITELHNLEVSILEDADHTLYCTDCTYTVTEMHSLHVTNIDAEAECVWVECLGCSLQYFCNGYQYTMVDVNTHRLYCGIECSYQLIEDHFFEYTYYNSYQHIAICQHCSATKYEEHVFVNNHGRRECVWCGSVQ